MCRLDGYGVGLGRTSGQNLASEPLGEVQRDGALAESFPVGLEPQVEAYMRPLRPPLIYKRPQGLLKCCRLSHLLHHFL